MNCELSKVGHDPRVWLGGGANKRWWALDNGPRDFDPNVWELGNLLGIMTKNNA